MAVAVAGHVWWSYEGRAPPRPHTSRGEAGSVVVKQHHIIPGTGGGGYDGDRVHGVSLPHHATYVPGQAVVGQVWW